MMGRLAEKVNLPDTPANISHVFGRPLKTTWRAERSDKGSDEMHQGKIYDYFQSIKNQWKSTS